MKKRIPILTTINVIVLALCLSVATYAWFSANKQIGTDNIGMTIQAVSDVTTISCYALRYDGTIGTVCYKIGEGAAEVLDVEMTEFDRIFRDRSVNTPLIYAVELANVPDVEGYKINVKVPCTQKFLKLSNNTTVNDYFDDGTGNYSIQRYISNVISVKIGCGGAIPPLTATTTIRNENNVSVFTTQQAAFRLVTSGDRLGKFASVAAEGEGDGTTYTYSKEGSVVVSLSRSEYSSSLYDAEDEDGTESKHLMLYIQFDYDQELMDYFIEHMMDDSEGDISFADDLGVIQILVGR